MERIAMKTSYARSETEGWLSQFPTGPLSDILTATPDLKGLRITGNPEASGMLADATVKGAEQFGRGLALVRAFTVVREDIEGREVSLVERYTKRMVRVNFYDGSVLQYDTTDNTWKHKKIERGLRCERDGMKLWVSGDTYMRQKSGAQVLRDLGGIWDSASKRWMFIVGELHLAVDAALDDFRPTKYHYIAQWLTGGQVVLPFDGLNKQQFGTVALEAFRRETWKSYGFRFQDFPFPVVGSSLYKLIEG